MAPRPQGANQPVDMNAHTVQRGGPVMIENAQK
jgi:hypothetical protein